MKSAETELKVGIIYCGEKILKDALCISPLNFLLNQELLNAMHTPRLMSVAKFTAYFAGKCLILWEDMNNDIILLWGDISDHIILLWEDIRNDIILFWGDISDHIIFWEDISSN